MVVWYHRELPIQVDRDGRPVVPRQIDPGLLEGAARLGKAADFLVVPCNSAHVGVRQIEQAAGCRVLSMVDVTLDEVARRGWRRVGVLGFGGAPAVYVDPLAASDERTVTIDGELANPAALLAEAAVSRAIASG